MRFPCHYRALNRWQPRVAYERSIVKCRDLFALFRRMYVSSRWRMAGSYIFISM